MKQMMLLVLEGLSSLCLKYRNYLGSIKLTKTVEIFHCKPKITDYNSRERLQSFRSSLMPSCIMLSL